jgi:hypothetical protein
MRLGLSLSDGGPDLALLFLAMRLITSVPSPEMHSAADSHLYAACKRFLAQLESAGTLSVLYLQAMILVALYEFGHSVYPAAWMTSGSCVRYAAMLGLPSYQESSTILGPCTTCKQLLRYDLYPSSNRHTPSSAYPNRDLTGDSFVKQAVAHVSQYSLKLQLLSCVRGRLTLNAAVGTEAEERRRVWWATQILDRVISLGSKKRLAGTLDLPVDTEMLPVDDLAWDSGDMAFSFQRSAARTPLEDPTTSPFARLAQASMFASRAMAHCKEAARRYGHRGPNDSAKDVDENGENKDAFGIKDAMEIIRDLHKLGRSIETGIANGGGVGSDAYFALIPSQCLVWSTIIMVMDLYSCPEHMRPGAGISNEDGSTEEGLKMQAEAMRGLLTTSERIKVFAGELLSLSDSPTISPDVSMAGVGDGDGGGGGGGGEEAGAMDRMSPLCFDAIYCALATFHWYWKENGLLEMRQGLEQTRAALVRMAPRWRLAGEYLGIERHHDVTGITTGRGDES